MFSSPQVKKLALLRFRLAQVIAGLRYAFPQTLSRVSGDYPLLMALHERVEKIPCVASYLASERRIAFNQQGIFRYYEELDA